MWPKISYFSQNPPPAQEQLRMQVESTEQTTGASPTEQIRSWANDISDCMNAMAGVDTGRYSHKAFASAMERLDEIVREMDAYGTR